MTKLIRIDASAGGERSASRRLGDVFERRWRERRGAGRTAMFDLVQAPPPPMSEAFIAAAYTPPDQRDEDGRAALAYSDHALDELAGAAAVLITTPMYNFGLPGALKAWFDQIIRIGVSFGTTDDPARPYVPLMRDKPVVVITARGSAAMVVGGAQPERDFLTPHLRTLLGFIGFSNPIFFDICGTEEAPETWRPRFDALLIAIEQAARVQEGTG